MVRSSYWSRRLSPSRNRDHPGEEDPTSPSRVSSVDVIKTGLSFRDDLYSKLLNVTHAKYFNVIERDSLSTLLCLPSIVVFPSLGGETYLCD